MKKHIHNFARGIGSCGVEDNSFRLERNGLKGAFELNRMTFIMSSFSSIKKKYSSVVCDVKLLFILAR